MENASLKKKPPLERAMLDKWSSLFQPSISGDGMYFGYVIKTGGSVESMLMLVDSCGRGIVKLAVNGWFTFTEDSRHIVCLNSHDSLCIGNLKENSWTYIPNVSAFQLVGNQIVYNRRDFPQAIFVSDIGMRKVAMYSDVKRWLRSGGNDESIIILQFLNSKEVLCLLNLRTNKRIFLWEGDGFRSVIVDNAGKRIVVAADMFNGKLFFLDIYKSKSRLLEVPSKCSVDLDNIGHFNNDGDQIFLNVDEKKKVVIASMNVNIWSYGDSELKSQELRSANRYSYVGVLRLSDDRFLQLDSANDWLFIPKFQDSVVLVRHQPYRTSGVELNWNLRGRYEWSIISTKSGLCRRVDSGLNSYIVELSPSGKYLIYLDTLRKQYFSYECGTGIVRCLTVGIDDDWEKDVYKGTYGRGIAAWGDGDHSVFLYGKNDVWQVYLTGGNRPINLTGGYGRKRDLVFFLALEEYGRRYVRRYESLLLSAFNRHTKDNGFYRKTSDVVGVPDSLTMGPYVYDIADNPYVPASVNFAPIKSLKNEVYIVRRMSAGSSPNFFLTRDFKFFKQLSCTYPENEYNWYRSELVNWTSLSKVPLQGVLYKPENFDSTKIYPIIFNYYEIKSDGLNAFLPPGSIEGGCSINIPYYVSNGYLVFCLDIKYTIGDPMQGAYDAIISAANYVSSLTYVDSKRMGLQGCSWGAIQTNYIVTHCNLFAAACSASGLGDWISSYGSLFASGESMQGMYEFGQLRMGATLWESSGIYVKNSAVFATQNVSTPLLLMHTLNDDICPFSNIVEFFISLRRSGKRSWMLVYAGNHCVLGRDADDFGIRMKQFFDHYLKGELAPRWMTRGILRRDQIENNEFELDDSVLTPGTGLLGNE